MTGIDVYTPSLPVGCKPQYECADLTVPENEEGGSWFVKSI